MDKLWAWIRLLISRLRAQSAAGAIRKQAARDGLAGMSDEQIDGIIHSLRLDRKSK